MCVFFLQDQWCDKGIPLFFLKAFLCSGAESLARVTPCSLAVLSFIIDSAVLILRYESATQQLATLRQAYRVKSFRQ